MKSEKDIFEYSCSTWWADYCWIIEKFKNGYVILYNVYIIIVLQQQQYIIVVYYITISKNIK